MVNCGQFLWLSMSVKDSGSQPSQAFTPLLSQLSKTRSTISNQCFYCRLLCCCNQRCATLLGILIVRLSTGKTTGFSMYFTGVHAFLELFCVASFTIPPLYYIICYEDKLQCNHNQQHMVVRHSFVCLRQAHGLLVA